MFRESTFRRLASVLLAWFLLHVGALTAAPLLAEGQIQVVCSGTGGLKLVVQDGNAGDGGRMFGMDCPLCVVPVVVSADTGLRHALPAFSLSHAMRSIPAARISTATAPPLSSRGPPNSRA